MKSELFDSPASLHAFRKIEIIGAFFGIIFGSFLHFAYELSGNNFFVGLFSAVNESPWEHLKMYFFPILIFLIVEWFFVEDKKTLLLAKALEAIFGMTFIITFFYTYTGALGIENVIIDIGSFVLAVILGKVISYQVVTSKRKWQGYQWLHALVLFLIMILFFTATFIPPKLPLFEDKNTNSYGIDLNK